MHSYIFIISQNVKAETISNNELFNIVDHCGINFGVDYTDTLNENEKKRAIENLKSYFDIQIPSDDCDRYAISVSLKKQIELLQNIHQKLESNLRQFEKKINLLSGVNNAQFYLQNIIYAQNYLRNIARTLSGTDDEYIFYNLDNEGLYTVQDFTVFEMASNAKYYVIDAFDYHF